jgi:hypothetical protein
MTTVRKFELLRNQIYIFCGYECAVLATLLFKLNSPIVSVVGYTYHVKHVEEQMWQLAHITSREG